MIRAERVKRPLDAIPCDGCGGPLVVGDECWYDVVGRLVYCSPECARVVPAEPVQSAAAADWPETDVPEETPPGRLF